MSRSTQTIFGMPGVVLPFAGSAAPNGWLLCHGQAVSRTTYAHLFTVIGTTYGAGDGSTTFNVPDLRGEFIRGLDAGRNVDTGRTLGSAQSQAMERHNHYLPTSSGAAGDTPHITDTSWTTNQGANVFAAPSMPATTVDENASQFGSGAAGLQGTWAAETRPRNVALNHIIKT